MTTEQGSETIQPHAGRRRRSRPGPLAFVLMTLAAAGVVIAWVPGILKQQATVNILTFVLTTIFFAVPLVWFLFVSDYSKKARRTVAIVATLLIVFALAVVRFDGFTGDMIPTFRFVWQPTADQRLAAARPVGGAVDLKTTTPHDFPGFLGKNRDGHIQGVLLQTDWTAHPPQELWRQEIGAGWSGFAVVNGFAVTMEQRGPEELVTCYEIGTGKLRWQHALSVRHESVLGGVGPRSTPTIGQGRVYAQGATGVLRCLDGATGELLWSKNLPEEFGSSYEKEQSAIAWGRAASPLIENDMVIVSAGGPPEGPHVSLVAYHKETGEEVWRGGDQQISYSSPTAGLIIPVRQIVIVNESTVSGHSIFNGAALWTIPWDGSSRASANTSQPVLLGDGVLVSKGYGQGVARYRIRQGALLGWSAEKVYENRSVLRTKLTSAVLVGEYAFGLSDGILECIDIEDGKRQWKAGRFGHGQVLLVGDVLLVTSESGEVHLVRANPEQFEQLAMLKALDDTTWNYPCLYNDLLLVRNAVEVVCYRLAVRPTSVPRPAANPQE